MNQLIQGKDSLKEGPGARAGQGCSSTQRHSVAGMAHIQEADSSWSATEMMCGTGGWGEGSRRGQQGGSGTNYGKATLQNVYLPYKVDHTYSTGPKPG